MAVQSPPAIRTKRDREVVASVRNEILIDARPEEVWEALRARYALNERLVPGFVADTRLDVRRPDRDVLQRRGGSRGARRPRRGGAKVRVVDHRLTVQTP